MKLVHISDIHLTRPGERMGGLDPHRRFAQALDEVRNKHQDADRIIITGDLTHWGEPQAYAALIDARVDLPCPVRLLMGNHDDRANFLAVFPDQPRDANGYVNYAEDLRGTRLIYLDTTAPRTHAGHFGADRVAWLEKHLERCKRARLFMHHNVKTLGQPAEDKIALVSDALLTKSTTCISAISMRSALVPIAVSPLLPSVQPAISPCPTSLRPNCCMARPWPPRSQ